MKLGRKPKQPGTRQTPGGSRRSTVTHQATWSTEIIFWSYWNQLKTNETAGNTTGHGQGAVSQTTEVKHRQTPELQPLGNNRKSFSWRGGP